MSRSDCPVCRGSGVVRLPLYHPVPVSFEEAIGFAPAERNSKDFPCPECTPQTDMTKVMLVGAQSEVDSRLLSERGAIEHIHRSLVRRIGDEIGAAGHVVFEPPKRVDFERVVIRATIGMVSSEGVKTKQLQITEAQLDGAAAVIEAAIENVRNWGSHFTGRDGSINKDDAARQMMEALRDMRKEAKP